MANCSLDGNNMLYALLQAQNTAQPTLSSEVVLSNSVVTAFFPGINVSLIYNLTIISNNSLGIAFSESQQFCKFMSIC